MEEKKTRAINAYEIFPNHNTTLKSAPINRDWMDKTHKRFAYRCLPMTIANQAGWMIGCPVNFTAIWNGGPEISDTVFCFPDGEPNNLVSGIFGHGIITFNIAYLFRTPKDINLWVKGPSNWPKENVTALEGIVETDWNSASFTMNWKITSPNSLVEFSLWEPCCMIVPVQRHFLESFEPTVSSLADNPELMDEFNAWSQSRSDYQKKVDQGDPEAIKRGWQKDYFQGKNLNKAAKDFDHQTKLNVKEFQSE